MHHLSSNKCAVILTSDLDHLLLQHKTMFRQNLCYDPFPSTLPVPQLVLGPPGKASAVLRTYGHYGAGWLAVWVSSPPCCLFNQAWSSPE